MFRQLRADIACILERDPAARSTWEVLTCYPGLHAIYIHKLSRWFWVRGLRWFGRLTSHLGRWLTGNEIHPGATIGRCARSICCVRRSAGARRPLRQGDPAARRAFAGARARARHAARKARQAGERRPAGPAASRGQVAVFKQEQKLTETLGNHILERINRVLRTRS